MPFQWVVRCLSPGERSLGAYAACAWLSPESVPNRTFWVQLAESTSPDNFVTQKERRKLAKHMD